MSDIIEFTVTGMTCNGCAGKVRGALENTDGVAGAEVDHATGIVQVRPDGSVPAGDLEFALDEAVESVGYTVASS